MAIHPAVASYLADWDQHRWLIEEEEAEARRRAEAARPAPARADEPKRPVLTVKPKAA